MFPLPPLVPWALLVLAALLGALLVVRLLRGRNYPRRWGWGHAAVALIGVVVLGACALAGPPLALLDDGTLFLLMAAFGGFTLAVLTRGGDRPPGALLFLHALFALFGLLLLTIAIVSLPLMSHRG